MSLLEVFGALSTTSTFCWACVEGKSSSWQGNGDKWGRASLIWGCGCRAGSYYQPSVSINSTLLPEKPWTCCLQQGRFTFVCRLKQLFQPVTEELWHLQLSFPRLSPERELRKCELCLSIPGSLSLRWEACLWLRGWNPPSPLEKSYLAPSSFPFLRLFPLGACWQP